MQQKGSHKLLSILTSIVLLVAFCNIGAYASGTTSDTTKQTSENQSSSQPTAPTPPAQSSQTQTPPAQSSQPQTPTQPTTPQPPVTPPKKEPNEKEQIKDLNDKMDDLKEQQDALQKQINSAKTEKDKQLAIKKQLNSKITISQQKINLLIERINLLTKDIKTKEEEIAVLEQQSSETYDTYKQRLRAMYVSGNQTILGAVLGAESFGDFLTRAEILKRVSKHDQELLDLLKAQKEKTDAAKAELEADKKQQESDRAEVEKLKKELNGQLTQTNSKIQDISEMEKEFLADKARLQKQMAEVQSEIDDIYKQLGGSTGEFVGGRFGWPVPGYTYISSYYGWRFGGSDFHTGIDITGAGVNGKAIVAANKGTVVHVTLSYTPGRGYGKYLIVDHGGGYTTLYGHTSDINVSVGEHVSKGQRIASVGSTGWSTGPHLHFEIRVNGKHTNPISYLK